MKTKIILAFTCLLMSFLLHAQNPGDYVKEPGLDKYVGSWEWTAGNEKFTLVIVKRKLLFDIADLNYYEDKPVAWHSYTKNGQVINSSMDKLNMPAGTVREAFKIAGMVGTMMDDYIGFSFTDTGTGETGKITFKLVLGNTNLATWELSGVGGLILYPEGNPPPAHKGYSLPRKMTFIKVGGNEELPPPTKPIPPKGGGPIAPPGMDVVLSKPAEKK